MINRSELYDKNFYKKQEDGSTVSAKHVIPILLEIFQPNSVIDIGCGIGAWLNVFKNNHVKDVLGIDGDYVDKNMLQIDRNEFVSHNLENVFISPKKFDLAISLEVGEHLSDKHSDKLVESLTNSADFIMFSAAIPGQTGTYHINEQYPEYWAKKFLTKGYVCIDYIRKEIWDVKEIDFWYRQNILLFIKRETYESTFKQKLEISKQHTDPEFLTRIHPEMMLYYKEKFYQTRSFIGFMRYHLFPIKKIWGLKKVKK